MHVPAWLLRIMVSYLTERKMIMRYCGQESKVRMLPAGGPQGAYLGILIFIIKFNGAFLRPPIPRDLIAPINQSESVKVKYIDDGTVAVSIPLKDLLVPDPVVQPQPVNFHQRTGHILPTDNNLLQFYLNDAEIFINNNGMKINKKKSNVMMFNKSRKYDFPPELKFSDGTNLDVISEVKLLGIIVSDDLKWQKNTNFITSKAMKKLWILRRLKKLNMSKEFMIDVFIKEVRSTLEQGVAVWSSGLTREQIAAIERVQKTALYIIFDRNYVSYEVACTLSGLEPLEIRREKLCLSFAKKNLKAADSLFTRVVKNVNTRKKRVLVKEYKCRTRRFERSSLPYLSKLLNTKN